MKRACNHGNKDSSQRLPVVTVAMGEKDDVNTDLRNAAIEGDLAKVKDLLERGADVNQKNQVSTSCWSK